MTVYCDAENCEYNEDGCCCKEKININGMFCNSNLLKEENQED